MYICIDHACASGHGYHLMDRSEWKNPFKCSTAVRSICELPDVCDTRCQQAVLFWNRDLLETLPAIVYKTCVQDQRQDRLL